MGRFWGTAFCVLHDAGSNTRLLSPRSCCKFTLQSQVILLNYRDEKTKSVLLLTKLGIFQYNRGVQIIPYLVMATKGVILKKRCSKVSTEGCGCCRTEGAGFIPPTPVHSHSQLQQHRHAALHHQQGEMQEKRFNSKTIFLALLLTLWVLISPPCLKSGRVSSRDPCPWFQLHREQIQTGCCAVNTRGALSVNRKIEF